MGILDKILPNKNKEEKKVDLEEVDKKLDKILEEPKVEEPKVEEEGIVELPEGKVNRVAVPYIPAPKPNPIFNSDSNEKDPKTPSFL